MILPLLCRYLVFSSLKWVISTHFRFDYAYSRVWCGPTAVWRWWLRLRVCSLRRHFRLCRWFWRSWLSFWYSFCFLFILLILFLCYHLYEDLLIFCYVTLLRKLIIYNWCNVTNLKFQTAHINSVIRVFRWILHIFDCLVQTFI